MQRSLCLLLLLFHLLPDKSCSQILVTEMGKVRFFNSFDSTKSARLISLAGRCDCFLQMMDSTHQKLVKLDVNYDDSIHSDSVVYLLDFNTLTGNYNPSDSLALPAANSGDSPSPEAPGIYIRVRDSVIRTETILQLLYFSVRHYNELVERKKTCPACGPLLAADIIKQKPPPAFRKTAAYCK